MTGRTILHYRLLEQLGRGGMGVVYKAEDLNLGRFVAIKVLPPLSGAPAPAVGTLKDGESPYPAKTLERFRREARAASALNHPNICTVHDAGEFEGQPFIVMEYLEGETLKARLWSPKGGKPLDTGEALDLALQITDGLAAAHAQGIIHRDIKPANIFITTEGRAKILDFGLAKTTAPAAVPAPAYFDGAELPSGAHEITAKGAALGSLGYMSPEQARGEALDARSDIFSLGLVLLDMASACRRSVHEGAPATGTRDEAGLAALAGFEAACSKCVRTSREARYQSAVELKNDLKNLCAETQRAGPAHGRTPRKWALALVGVLGAWAAVTGVYYLRTQGAAATGGKRELVLADFANSTGDPVFDGTLRRGLAVALEQSPFLNVVASSEIEQALAYMGQPADAPLTPQLALEVCAREGDNAVLAGSVSQLGSAYVVGITATDCSTRGVLAETQTTAASKEKVLNALGRGAAEMRAKLGESLRSVREYDTALEEATTSSLEALQAFRLGWLALERQSGYAESIPFFQQAIKLDPGFATAYEELGVAYANLGENERASEYLGKAFDLRGRVSERERLHIVSHYYDLVSGDLEKARETYQVWVMTYPQDATGHGSLGVSFALQGRYQEAVAETQEALRLEPHDATWTANLMNFYLALGRLNDARATYDAALRDRLDAPYLHFLRYQLAFLERDSGAMAQQVAWGQGQPGVDDVLLAYESDTEAYFGRIEKARELTREAVDSAGRAGHQETAAGWAADGALREALFGDTAAARSGAAAAAALSDGRDVAAATGFALAFAGDTSDAAGVADSLGRRFPNDTAVKTSYLPVIRGVVATHEGLPDEALGLLRSSSPYELGFPSVTSLLLNLYPIYARGMGDLALGRGADAAVEFRKLRDHPGLIINEPIGALARLGLARALALDGANAAARDAYQDFFTLWKDADPRIPVLRDARAEYERLK